MNEIKQLPSHVANQIAAGEVVERPLSVIKELLENALDANTTSLHIDIEKGGLGLCRVRDNGAGIASAQLPLAIMPHATSKIKSVDDLMSLHSLGFRGEALASISSVSRFKIISKPADQASAGQITVDDEGIGSVQSAAHPDGTTIEVRDLFYNVPVRRTFLKSEKTEFSHIEMVVKKIALSRFDLAIHLTHNGKTQLKLPITKTEAEIERRVSRVLGKAFVTSCTYFEDERDEYGLRGWLGSPEYLRSQNDLQYLFLNGRMVRDKVLLHAVKKVYEPYLYPGRSACFLLYFSIPLAEVDVNVHPTKHEVRFKSPRSVHDFIISVLSHALNQEAESEEVFVEHQQQEQVDLFEVESIEPKPVPISTPIEVTDTTFQFSDFNSNQIISLNETHGLFIYQGNSILFDVADTYRLQMLSKLKALIGEEKTLSPRPVLVPLMVSLSDIEISDLVIEKFKQFGFEVSRLNEGILAIRSFPVVTPHLDISNCIKSMAEACSNEAFIVAIAENQSVSLALLNEAEKASLMRFLVEQNQQNPGGSAFKSISQHQWQELLNE